VACFDNPELTFSARILRSMIDQGIGGTGKALGEDTEICCVKSR
jgi:glutamate--cysteine ligase